MAPSDYEKAQVIPESADGPSSPMEAVKDSNNTYPSTSMSTDARKRVVVMVPAEAEEMPVKGGMVVPDLESTSSGVTDQESGRERLKRHRTEMAGRVWIPESWGQEKLLSDWKDCAVIDRSLFPTGLLSAREALVEECRRTNSGRVRIGNSC